MSSSVGDLDDECHPRRSAATSDSDALVSGLSAHLPNELAMGIPTFGFLPPHILFDCDRSRSR
jgi:hypothetical protein